MLRIIEDELTDDSGVVLKMLACPKKVSEEHLTDPKARISICAHCDREVVNTDYLSEEKIIALLKDDPDTCLKINRLNPIFQIDAKARKL